MGICKNCYRAICGDCAAEIPDGIACVNRCEPLASQISSLISRNARFSTNTRKAGAQYTFLGIFFALFGLITAVVAATSTTTKWLYLNSAVALLLLASGGAAILYGRWINRIWAPFFQPEAPAPHTTRTPGGTTTRTSG